MSAQDHSILAPANPTVDMQPVRLEVKDLKTYFFLDEGILKAVDGVSMTVRDRETIGVIGESGSGKTAFARSLMRLTVKPGEIVKGEALLRRKNGATTDILGLEPDSKELRSLRGNDIAMIFQEPMTAFSPVHTIGAQIGQMVGLHTQLSKPQIRERVVELLRRVGISNPSQRFDEYPHQLSGGMRQRAMIAMALSCNPKIVLADEPTTALDVTIQAQILELLGELQQSEQMAVIYITHNLAVVAESVDYVHVMYLGKVVESAPTRRLFANPLHPYTRQLLRSIPRPGVAVDRLEVIKGTVPTPLDPPWHCPFFSRCPDAMPGTCDQAMPELVVYEPGHFARCYLHSQATEPEDEWTRV
jgi:oligopeptide/dipeptide ABC transporter ATP-binding protein